MPTASLAAIFAMGKPVALDASAELRLTRGFISMIVTRPSRGFTANWMLEPPVSTPIFLMMRIAMSRRFWYSISDSVCCGATVMESPVWTPIGSKFSMEQMITTLSAVSRITSSSNSFQPITDSSISTWWMGDSSSPRITFSMKSSRLYTMLPPVPPSVKAGRMMTGRDIFSISTSAPSIPDARPDSGTCIPISIIAFLKRSRSSARRIASIFAPISSTPNLRSVPLSSRNIAQLSAVCPPTVGSTASGRSFSMMASTISGVMGSI